MQRRWFPALAGMLCLLLLPSAALAANTGWGNRSRTANNQSNRNYRNGAWGAPTRSSGNRGGFGTWGARNRTSGTPNPSSANHGGWGRLGTRTPSSANQGGWGYSNNNGSYGNSNYGQGGYSYRDRDGDGDRDYWRHRHYRHHRRHDDDDDDDDGGWRNGRWSGSTPPGWQHGRKTGWGNSDLPPGQAKKAGW
jgi:hypothetical protein